ncbi:MAG: hypothetical protein PUB76_10320 [Oscillospiraceae bacterium]|nr:hypothetical protein [Oscillospiraceae bacterium]MDY3257151.1 hypothetical protein [Ruminococcus callidus]
MNDIYKKLYDAAKEKCGDHIEDFEIFDVYSRNNPLEVNVSELYEMKASSNIAFLKIAFIKLLNRPIDQKALESWEKRASLPEKEFRKLVISRLISSEEATATGKIYLDNVISDENVLENVVKQSSVFLQVARKTYQKMPEPVKDAVRKMRGIES